jgi:XRE family transcriptional regulator, regulator of sulfur utilization
MADAPLPKPDAPFPQPAFGRVIRRLRRERDVSQQALARVADVGAKYLSEVERGKSNPTVAIAYKLADALGLRGGELFVHVDEEVDGARRS